MCYVLCAGESPDLRLIVRSPVTTSIPFRCMHTCAHVQSSTYEERLADLEDLENEGAAVEEVQEEEVCVACVFLSLSLSR